jgi:hypothetical protein
MFTSRLRKITIISMTALLPLSMLIFTGCPKDKEGGASGGTGTGGPVQKKLAAAAVALREDDGSLSKSDVDSLKKIVAESKAGRFSKWKGPDGQVNADSLVDFLVNEGIVPNRDAILNPIPESFGVNLFIKNSANMYGYINPKSEFQEALFGLLVDLKASKSVSGITLSHVNTVVSSSVPFDSDKAAVDYIHKVDRAAFANRGKEKGGNPGETDFDKVFEHVLKAVDKGGVGILAADFILSPGKGMNTDDYVKKHGNAVKAKFLNKIDELDIAVLVLRMQSYFDGNYWNRKSEGVGRLTAQRPYYIWFIGAPQHLAKIIGNKRLMTTMKSNGYTGDYMVFESAGGANKEKELEFKVAASEKYVVSTKDRRTVSVLKMPRKGDSTAIFVDVNFNDAFRDSAFFVNAVRVSDGYSLKVGPSKNPRFKFRLTIKSEKLKRGTVRITVDGRIPEWVNAVNSTDDADIKKDASEQAKTYGFKWIMEGVYAAFYPSVSIDEPHVLQAVNLNVQLGDK